jgi:NitT/TauT family transport system substrate-binding protein
VATINMMALRHSAFYTPYLMTISGGYLQKEGLEPVYIPQSADNLVADAFAEGRCDVSQSAVAVNFNDLEAGRESRVMHFAQINARDGFIIAARQQDSEFTWSKLADREILVDHFFQPLAMLKYGLHRQGVDYDSLIAIDAGDVEQIDRAFRAGQGEYVHQQGPAPQQLEKDGAGFVVAAVGDAVGPVAFSSIAATPEWLETEMAATFMYAYRQARAFVIEAPAEDSARLVSGHLPEIDMDVLINTIDFYKRLGCWEPQVEISPESYENLLDVFLYSNLITSRHAYAQCVVSPPGN